MQKLTKYISFLSSLTYGVALTNLPIEIFNQYAKITDFDANDPTITSLIEFGFLAGAMIGSLCTSLYAEKLGYTKSLRLVFVCEALFSIMSAIPVHWIYLAITRVFSGIAACAMLVLAPQLVGEVLSPKDRGFTMMMFSVALNVGNELAYGIHLPISLDYNYWYLTFALPVILSIFAAVCCHMLTKYQSDIEKLKQHEQTLTEVKSDSSSSSKSEGDEIIKKQDKKLTKSQFCRLLFVTLTLGATPTLDGVDAVLTYASLIFSNTFSFPHSGIYGSLIIGAVNIVCAIIATPFAERNKRKLMLMVGVIGIVITLFAIGFIYLFVSDQSLANILVLALIMLYLLFFNIGPQPIVFMFFGEMFPDLYKVKLNSIGYTALLGASVAMVFAFAYFQGSMQAYIYIMYGALTLICGVSGTLLAPETHNKTLKEIEMIIRSWGAKHDARSVVVQQKVSSKGTNQYEVLE